MPPTTRTDVYNNGRVIIWPRGAKGIYQARIKVPNSTGFILKSTNTTHLPEAITFASNLYDELYHHVKQGGSLKSSPTYTEVFNEWASYEHRANLTSTVGRYTLPFFKKEPFDKITEARLTDYWLHRRSTFIARKACNNTLLREATYMKGLFRYAKAKGYITTIPEMNPLNISPQATRRPTFTHQEWTTLTEAMVDWYEEPNIATRKDRQLAAYYFHVLANTGIRVGEARHLNWSQLRLHNNHLILTVTGKTGSREVVSNQGSFFYFDQLSRLTGNHKLLFCNIKTGEPIGSFKTAFHALLTYAGIPKANRTIYSLRHFWITEKLKSGVSAYAVAKNAGTSVEMLEKHYGQLVTYDFAELLNKGK